MSGSLRKHAFTTAVAVGTALVVIGLPVSAHVTKSVKHTWKHIRPLADARYELKGTPTQWGQIQGMPAGFADGVDNEGSTGPATDLNCTSCVQEGELAFNPATQAELDAHKASGDHDARYDARYWKLTGNAGTNPATDFVGTTDAQPLNFRVLNQRAFRLEPTGGDTPNVIGGFDANNASAGVAGATIGGGGNTSSGPNVVTDNWGTVGGGRANRAGNNAGTVSDREHATVGGGVSNIASGTYGTVAGGVGNTAAGLAAIVGGGNSNTAAGDWSTVAGGLTNTAGGLRSTIGGGELNSIAGDYATVGGGSSNQADNVHATIGGGWDHTASGTGATVGGGQQNTATGLTSVVAGGASNNATAQEATVAGGAINNATAFEATVGGGGFNTASGINSTVPGGRNTTASGDYSFAAGRQAQADDQGAFVWADSQTSDVISPGINTYSVRASGGIWLGTTSTPSIGVNRFIDTSTNGYLSTAGVWTDNSSREVKENFSAVDNHRILETVADLPISMWNYKGQEATIRHIGPVAEDFHAAFGVGDDPQHIASLDSAGVALAAIQGLNQVVRDQEAQIAQLENRLGQQPSATTPVADTGFPVWLVLALVAPLAVGGGIRLARVRR